MFPPRFFCSWVTAWVKTLSRWAGTDRILVEEFNDNWDTIDAALKSTADKAAALQTALAGAGNCSISLSSYTGTGKAGSKNPTVIHFPKKPTFFIIRGKTAILFGTELDCNSSAVIWDYVSGITLDHVSLSWSGSDIKIYSAIDNFPDRMQLNAANETYHVIAFYRNA